MLNTEVLCQTQTVDQFSDVGKITLKKPTARIRKPAWLVLTKLVGMAGMLVAALILIPEQIPFVYGLQATVVALPLILAYVVVAHFVRPKANTDNLGALGVADDKSQYYDDVNRNLLAFDVALGPGRFIASTIIDACTLAGILSERTQEDIEQSEILKAQSKQERPGQRNRISSRCPTCRKGNPYLRA